MNKIKLYIPPMIAIIFTLVMMFIDVRGGSSYLTRSILKVIIFGVIPITFLKYQKIEMPNLKINKISKKVLIFAIISTIAIICTGVLLIKLGMLENVRDSLANSVGVKPSNYILVFLYIVFINGPLEEIFFRHSMLMICNSKLKTLISSFLFAIYHIGMLRGMFDFYLFVTAVLGLMLVGYLFIKINISKNSILNSVILHMFANLGINTIGFFIMYDII